MKANIRMPEFVPPGKGAVEGNLDPSSEKGGTRVHAHRRTDVSVGSRNDFVLKLCSSACCIYSQKKAKG